MFLTLLLSSEVLVKTLRSCLLRSYALGSEDPAMPLENMQKLAGLVGGQDLKVMSVGHVPSVEAPDEFNQVLRAWFGNVKA